LWIRRGRIDVDGYVEKKFGSNKNGYGIEHGRKKTEEEVVERNKYADVCVNDVGHRVKVEDRPRIVWENKAKKA